MIVFRTGTICAGVRNNLYVSKSKEILKLLATNGKFGISTSVAKWKHISITPASCLQDESVNIRIQSLPKGAEVTLTSTATNANGQDFFTYTHYKASEGSIDLAKDASVGGTYKGIFPMGPIASLKGGPNESKYLRFIKKNVCNPLLVDFKLLQGHLKESEAYAAPSHLLLDTARNERHYMAPGTERIPIRVGKLKGTLFLPSGDGPFPGVIDLFGTAGGLIEFRSAQLASRGIASFALAYFAYEDQPKTLDIVELAYFEEAVHYMLNNKKVNQCGIGVVGTSKGADIACSMGVFIPEVKAVVGINGVPAIFWCPLKVADKLYPSIPIRQDKIKFVTPELISTHDVFGNSDSFPESQLPLHESDCEFMIMAGLEDANWDSAGEAVRARDRALAHGKHNVEVKLYPGTGHLLEPPYSPFAFATYHKIMRMSLVWGGSALDHCAGQEKAWEHLIAFFRRNLA